MGRDRGAAKMLRWMFKHKIAFVILFNTVGWIPFLLVLFTTQAITAWLVFGMLMSLLSSILYNSSVETSLTDTAIKQLYEQCDPYPLLERTTQQLQSKANKTYRLSLLIGKAFVLRSLGRFDEAFSVLSSIQLDQNRSKHRDIRIVYYCNLVDILIIRGNLVQAHGYNSELQQLINGLNKVDDNLKKRLSEIPVHNQARLLFAYGNYYESEALFRNLSEPQWNIERVFRYLFYAKLCLKQNRIDEAMPYLQYVISNGNKLYDVMEASELLRGLQG